MRRILPLLVLLCLCPTFPVLAGQSGSPAPADTLQERLERFYQSLESLSFAFRQETRSSGRIRQGEGTGLFIRAVEPSRFVIMRWDYTGPERQVIINDGRELSIYTPGRHQVVISKVSPENSDITSVLFSGDQSLADTFRVTPPDDRFTFELAGTPLTRLRLEPRVTRPRVRAIQLWLDPDLRIRHLLLEDHLDSITRITFSDIRLNPVSSTDRDAIDRALDLDLPPGTEIIRQ